MNGPLPARAIRLRALLHDAGRAALACIGTDLEIRRKADESPVTRADLAAERVLLAGLAADWPDDAIASEEAGKCGARDGAARWVVDPIDGTSAFTEGLAHWGPTLGRFVNNRLDCAALWLPRLDEHYHVEGGHGWYNGRRLPLLPADLPAVVYLPSRFHLHFRLHYRGKTRCLGGTAAHLALISRGAAAAAIVAPGWSLWDTAAGLGLIEATGGVALRLEDGAPLDPCRDEGAPFVAGAGELAHELARPGRIVPL